MSPRYCGDDCVNKSVTVTVDNPDSLRSRKRGQLYRHLSDIRSWIVLHRTLNTMTFYNTRRAFCLTSAFVLLLVSPLSTFTRQDEIPKGSIIERVVCITDPTQSYALYLPSDYSPQKKWPVIYAFDPDARGNVPVKLYQEAAEKYGYIVAGSYNSQNGMQTAALQNAISKLIGDTRSRFSIDEKRVYATGFSGGARVATRVASSCSGCIAGVIACGAGFPSDITPTSATSFVLYGTVGIDDFNFPELKRLDDKLDAINVPHRIATFSGGHEWASSSLLVQALEWIEIQAMRAGRKAHDDLFIDAEWKKRIELAHAQENEKKLFDAFETYRSMIADFKGLKEIAECESKMRALRETKEVKQALKDEQEQLTEQLDIAKRIIDLGATMLEVPSKRSSTLKDMRVIIENLRLKAKLNDDSRERRIARRAIRQVLAQTYEAAMFAYLPNQQYDVALANLEVAALIVPDSWRIPFEMARAFSMIGEKKKAILSLQNAIEKGLTDPTVIEDQKDFANIRNEGAFRLTVERLRKGIKD